MNLSTIKSAIVDIVLKSNDDEAAHVLEDNLYFKFIQYIADVGTGKQQRMAKLLLTVDDIDFNRHCA